MTASFDIDAWKDARKLAQVDDGHLDQASRHRIVGSQKIDPRPRGGQFVHNESAIGFSRWPGDGGRDESDAGGRVDGNWHVDDRVFVCEKTHLGEMLDGTGPHRAREEKKESTV